MLSFNDVEKASVVEKVNKTINRQSCWKKRDPGMIRFARAPRSKILEKVPLHDLLSFLKHSSPYLYNSNRGIRSFSLEISRLGFSFLVLVCSCSIVEVGTFGHGR